MWIENQVSKGGIVYMIGSKRNDDQKHIVMGGEQILADIINCKAYGMQSILDELSQSMRHGLT